MLQIGEVKVPLCMVDLAQTIEEWKDIQSIKVDDQVRYLSFDIISEKTFCIFATFVFTQLYCGAHVFPVRLQ